MGFPTSNAIYSTVLASLRAQNAWYLLSQAVSSYTWHSARCTIYTPLLTSSYCSIYNDTQQKQTYRKDLPRIKRMFVVRGLRRTLAIVRWFLTGAFAACLQGQLLALRDTESEPAASIVTESRIVGEVLVSAFTYKIEMQWRQLSHCAGIIYREVWGAWATYVIYLRHPSLLGRAWASPTLPLLLMPVWAR